MSGARTINIFRGDGMREYEQHMCDFRRGEVALRLPREITHGGALGRSVSFAQLIATWAAHSSERYARTTLLPDDHDSHERFVSRLHGLAAAYYANRLLAADGATILRRTLLQAAIPRIHAMNKRQFAQTAKGPTAELVFVIGARNEFHSAAYREKPTLAQLMDSEQHGNLIVSANEMNALISNILVKLKVPSLDLDRLSPLLGRETVSLGDLLHETFRNTAEHAYLDLDDRIPKEGLRCILIAIRNMQPGQIQANAIVSAEHQHLSRYVRRLSRRASVARRSLVCLFELSVFDTGPGFAGTMELQSDASDIDRVAHCFRDYVSKKPGPNSGLGLGRVLKSVHSLDGYLRVRTSTAEVFFSAATPMPSDTGPVPSVVGGLPKVVGTAITIGIPLEL